MKTLPHITRSGQRATRWDEGYPGRQVTGALMLLAVLLLGNREILNYNTTVGYLFGLVLAPLWLAEFRRYKFGRAMICCAVLCLISGLWLSWYTAGEHTVVRSTFLGAVGLFLGLFVTVMVLLWARRIFPIWVLGFVYGVGMLSSISSSGLAQENLWKYALAMPLTLISLSLAAGIRARYQQSGLAAEVLVLGTLATLALVHDGRSMFGTLLVVTALVGWQLLPEGRNLREAMLRSVVSLGLLIVGIYQMGTAMALDGLLGQAAQERSVMQLEMSGSLLVGGRPEMLASLYLMANRPMGYGLGIQPELSDIRVAKEGMASIGYNPDNGYVERFMFGSQFELHSTAADLWVTMGLPGLLVALIIAVACVLWILHGVASRSGSALVLFLAVYTLWNLAFSPLYSALPTLGLTLGLMFSLRSSPNSRSGMVETALAPGWQTSVHRSADHS